MNVKEAIKKRRSIRKYKKKQVSEELINELLEAARLAPSACHGQPWKFMAITDEQTISKLKENKIFYQDFIYTAPLLLVCMADPSSYPEKKLKLDGVNKDQLIDAISDLSFASQNLVLRATELGLGTCYIGWMKKQKIKKVLNIPDDLHVQFVIAVGYADEIRDPKIRKSIDEIIL